MTFDRSKPAISKLGIGIREIHTLIEPSPKGPITHSSRRDIIPMLEAMTHYSVNDLEGYFFMIKTPGSDNKGTIESATEFGGKTLRFHEKFFTFRK